MQEQADIPARVAAYRREHRRARVGPRYSGLGHLAFTTFGCASVLAAALVSLEAIRPVEWLAVPVTFFAANLGEYLAHRYAMHRRRRGLGFVFERHDREHHRFFTHEAMGPEGSRDLQAILLPPGLFIFFVATFALPLGGLFFALVSANVGWLFVATAVGYFLLYEWLHLAYHMPPESPVGSLGPIRRMRRLHATHHDPRRMRFCNFNITFPIGDLLFGTYWRGAAAGRRERATSE